MAGHLLTSAISAVQRAASSKAVPRLPAPALQALREGEVEALVVRGAAGDQIYTLQGAEEPYRTFVEQMRQGAVGLAESGDILYSNAQFASLVGAPLESIVGGPFHRFIADADESRMSLNAGLRWEGQWNPQPTRPNPANSETAKIPNDLGMWQPRLGLTWDATGSGRTIVRATV